MKVLFISLILFINNFYVKIDCSELKVDSKYDSKILISKVIFKKSRINTNISSKQ